MLDTWEKVRLFAQFLGALVGHEYTDGEVFDGLMVARQNGVAPKVRKPRRARVAKPTAPEEDNLPDTPPPPPQPWKPFERPRRGRPKGSRNKPKDTQYETVETPIGEALENGEAED
jgi:hypothetical protein